MKNIFVYSLTFLICSVVRSQLHLFNLDSTHKYANFGSLAAEYTTKQGKVRTTANANGNMSMYSVLLKCQDCTAKGSGKFTFDRREIYQKGTNPVVYAHVDMTRRRDTLEIKVPRPKSIDIITPLIYLKPTKGVVLDFMVAFDNGERIRSLEHPNIHELIYFDQLPEGFNYQHGKLVFNGKKQYDTINLHYAIWGVKSDINTLTVIMNYHYSLELFGKGIGGGSGRFGRYGSDGNAGSSGSVANGNDGMSGYPGDNGGDGHDMEIYLKLLNTGIHELQVFSPNYKGDSFYVNLKSGGRVIVDLSGGRGGYGGGGGNGGVGAGATDSTDSGYGGDGGNGGAGGKGGRGGILQVYVDSASLPYINGIILWNEGGAGGGGGPGGGSGSGGTTNDSNQNYPYSGISGANGDRGGHGPSGPPMRVIVKP